jgi:phenylacetate-CoA ligase
MGAGVAFDCGNGWHIAEDAFFAEVVDADGEPVEDGACGQLVLTTLVREAMPLIRYATGIEGTLTHETCECGRTTARFHVKKNG